MSPYMGPYGPLWAHMGPYGLLWARMGPYGPLWAHIWAHTGPPGQVLAGPDMSDFRLLVEFCMLWVQKKVFDEIPK